MEGQSWGPNRVREVGRSVSPSSFIFLSSSSASPPLPPTLGGTAIAFLFCLCCALLLLLLLLSRPLCLPPSSFIYPSISLLRRTKMVHGRSRAPISPRILRGGSTSTPLYPARSPGWPLLPVLPLYSPRFFASPTGESPASRFFFAVFLSLCTRLHRSLF